MLISEENLKRIISLIPEGSGLVIFDGSCVLCNSTVGYLLKIDRRRKLHFATFDSEILKNDNLSSTASKNPKSLVFIDGNGICTESVAVLKILKMTGSYPLLRRIGSIIPRFLSDALYRLIARYRYRWFGKTEHCIVPGPDNAGRFYW